MGGLDATIRSALTEFTQHCLDGSWDGCREREAVSAFAFGPLLNQISADGFLTNSTQISLEVPIPQVVQKGEQSDDKKNQVCKDIVIWDQPGMTCWDELGEPTIAPAAVLEWKYPRSSRSVSLRKIKADESWLEAFTKQYPHTTGYAVVGDGPDAEVRLSCARFSEGRKYPKWLHLK